MIVAVVNLKGGSGKTTTALHLAACAPSPVTVVDLDPEGSAIQWASHAGALPFGIIPGERNGIARQVRALKGNVILDTPPNDREILVRVAGLAKVCIVPVGCAGLDVDRLRPTLELLRDLQAERRGLDVEILLTRWDARTILSREAAEALKGYPVLKAKIRQLARYAQAFGVSPTYLEEYARAWKEIT